PAAAVRPGERIVPSRIPRTDRPDPAPGDLSVHRRELRAVRDLHRSDRAGFRRNPLRGHVLLGWSCAADPLVVEALEPEARAGTNTPGAIRPNRGEGAGQIDRGLQAFRGSPGIWCGREDSNFLGLSPTTTSTLRVYQFRHDRIIDKGA